MLNCIILFVVTFTYVFAKAYQQRNVIHNNWVAIPLFSFMMAFLELSSFSVGVLDIAENGWHRILFLGMASGSGGTLGCWLAMYLHNRFHNVKT